MLSYIGRRLVLGLFTVWAVSVLSFVIIQLPQGDFVTTHMAELAANGNSSATFEAERLRAEYGLDQPMFMQYLGWMGQVVQGDYGMSFDWNRPVADVIGDRLALSMVVSVAAIFFT